MNPHKAAILCEEQQISYQELHERTNRSSCLLQSLGIRKGDRVAVMLKNCPEFIEVYLACSRLGAILVPINFRLSKAELAYILNNAEPKLFIFGSDYVAGVEGLNLHRMKSSMLLSCLGNQTSPPGILSYNKEIAILKNKTPHLKDDLGESHPEDPQVIMYTSGTTGLPKGAILSHRKTFFNCLNADLFFKMHFDDVMLIVLPLFHSGALFIQATPTIYKGATMVIHPKFDPPGIFRDIERFSVTKFLGVPTVYRALLKVVSKNSGDLSTLKVCAIGGEKTTFELLALCKRAGFPLRQIMGQTETSILLWASEEASLLKPGTVGKPVFHAEVELVDKQGNPVKPGEVGEIVVRGSIMMNGYWKDQARTEETIRDGWLHTGDLARMDEDGYFFLVDRAKDMYISGGENVYPAEIERVLREHPDIEDVAVIGTPDETWGEVGQAFVIAKQGSDILSEDVIRFCEGRLARYKWPKQVSFLKEFSRTPLGKTRKSVLREEHLSRGNKSF